MGTKCGNCGTEVDPSASQCPSCGATFDDSTSIVKLLPASWVGIGVGFGLVLLLGVLRIVGPVVLLGVGAGAALITWVLAEFVG